MPIGKLVACGYECHHGGAVLAKQQELITLIGEPKRHGDAGDQGVTIVEIVLAVAIVFFVATALFGLVSTSTLLSSTAKANTLAVNEMNSFIEKVRNLRYNDVTQARINTLAAASSKTVGGITVSITATVTPQWFADQNPALTPPAYKLVTVTATVTRPMGSPLVFSTGTYVSNMASTGSSGSTETPVPKPIVSLTSNTPKSGAVRGASVPLGMNAQSGGSGVTLTRLAITAGGAALPGLEKVTTAESDSISGFWDTTTSLPDGSPAWPDGSYEMRAQARDSRNQLSTLAWSLIVDNHPPDPPANLRKTAVVGNSSVTYRWDAAKDGPRDYVTEYQVIWYEQALTSSSFSPAAGTPMVITPSDPTTGTAVTLATSTFRRYYAEVRSRGPLAEGQTTPHFMSSPVTSTVHVARPSLAGSTVTVTDVGGPKKKAILRLDLRCDAPGFGTTGTTTYRWQYRYGPTGTWTDLVVATTPTHTVPSWTAPQDGFFKDMGISLRCVVTVTPSGGAAVSVPSSVVPFTKEDGKTGPATAGANDWTRWATPPTTIPAIDWTMWLL